MNLNIKIKKFIKAKLFCLKMSLKVIKCISFNIVNKTLEIINLIWNTFKSKIFKQPTTDS